MKNKFKLLIFSLILFMASPVFALQYTDEDIEDYSVVVGNHLFTYEPNEDTGYDGYVTIQFLMLGATSIKTNSVTDINAYFKYGDGDWIDYFTDDTVDFPENGFDIKYVNGVCVDPSCQIDTIKVTFKSDATVSNVFDTKEVAVKYGESIKASDVPAMKNRPGYKFVCWTMEGSDDCFDLNTTITEKTVPAGKDGIVLESKWSWTKYTITYNDGYSNGTTQKECYYGHDVNPCNFVAYNDLGFNNNAEYVFAGWSTVKNGTTVYNPGDDMSSVLGDNENITLYAIWKAKEYSVTYNLSGGTFNSSVSPQTKFTADDTSLSMPASPTKEGYTFRYWSLDNKQFSNSNLPKKNITLVAEWTENKYTITYNTNGGTFDTNNVTCDYSKCTTASTTPKKNGYEFAGWELENTGLIYNSSTSLMGFTKYITGNRITLNAKWTNKDKKIISYNLNGGVFDKNGYANATTFYLETSDRITIPDPTKDGYKFDGWYINDVKVTDINSALDGTDLMLEARWNANTYTVTFHSGDKEIDTISCTYDQPCDFGSHSDDASFDNEHVLVGWALTEDGKLYYGDDLSVKNLATEGNVDLYAVVRTADENIVVDPEPTEPDPVEEYTVTIELDGGELTNADELTGKKYKSGDIIDLSLYEPEKTGTGFTSYSFKSWQVNGEDVSGEYIVTGDVTFTATYDRTSTWG